MVQTVCWKRARKRGFTLVELLVVIAIIGILVGLLLPAVQAAREAARRMQCSNNVKQLSLAMHNYHDAHKQFPLGVMWRGPGNLRNNSTGWAWTAMILPYIEQAPLYNNLDFRIPPFDPSNTSPASVRNEEAIKTPLPFARCPSDPAPATERTPVAGTEVEWATASYSGNAGGFNGSQNGNHGTRSNGILMRTQGRHDIAFRNITDGSSNTFLVMESAWFITRTREPRVGIIGRKRWYGSMLENRNWSGTSNRQLCEGRWRMNPPPTLGNANIRRAASSLHTGGANFGLADGSVRFVSENIEHTARTWGQRNNPNRNDPYDIQNGGQRYGIYQRLWSVNDGLVIGEF